MDENSVGRMCARAFGAAKCRSALVLTSGVMLCSSLLWSISTTLLWGMTGRLSWTVICCSLAIAAIPAIASIAPVAHWFLTQRAGKSASVISSLRAQWRQSVIFALASISVAVLEGFVAIFLAVWIRLLDVPALGAMLYLAGSWVDRFVVVLMVTALFSFLLVAAPAAVAAVRMRWGNFNESFGILASLSQEWVVRCKLLFLGITPFVLFCLLSTVGGQILSRPIILELAASCVRAVIFSMASAPLLLFFICMTVEADRYIRWRQSR